jgi:hypothetical protein
MKAIGPLLVPNCPLDSGNADRVFPHFDPLPKQELETPLPTGADRGSRVKNLGIP